MVVWSETNDVFSNDRVGRVYKCDGKWCWESRRFGRFKNFTSDESAK